MGVYDKLGLQREYDLINKYYGTEEYNYLNDKERYKKDLMDRLKEFIKNDSDMTYNMLKITNELVNFFLDNINESPNKLVELIEIINKNEFLLMKTNQEIQLQSITLNRRLENFKDEIDKNDIINICKKRYLDIVESVNKKINILMDISNINKKQYSEKDKNSTLYEKLNRLKKMNELPFLRNSINRFIRNKIGHFDFYFDDITKMFIDSKNNKVCTMDEFVKYNKEIAGIEYGFFNSLNVIILLSISEIDFAIEYMRKIEEYLLLKDQVYENKYD